MPQRQLHLFVPEVVQAILAERAATGSYSGGQQ